VRAPLPLALAVLLVALAGPLLALAFPSLDSPGGWWPLAFVIPAAPLLALQGRRLGGAALVGFVFGLTFYLPLIPWMTQFLRVPGVEWVPWVALSVAMALYGAVGGMLIALAYRWIPRAWPALSGRLLVTPLVVAGLWTAREAVASTWPYGGFAWGRVGLSQAESPIAPVFSWLGVSGTSFVMVLLAAVGLAGAQEALRLRRAFRGSREAARLALRTGLALVAGLGVLVAVPIFPTAPAGSIRVAAVQGVGKTAYFDVREPGENLAAQVQATLPVLDDDLDVVLWPEGGSDLDPERVEYARAVFDTISRAASAPLVSGTITARQGATGEEYFNTSVVWNAGSGAGDHYDKKHPVPFGEYVPDRSFWRQFAPDLIDLIGREYTPGTTDQVLDVNGVLAGASICFDIVDDALQRAAIREGAEVLFAQSNNGDFGRTAEGLQQLAIARIRAIETGRAVVNISTVGTSAIILPDGSDLDRLTWYEPGAMVDDVPLYRGETPAVLFGAGIELLVSLLGLGALVVARLARRD